jgi:hypothetical protein
MSYLSYMTNRYQRATNDRTNDTKGTKYIQLYGHKKSYIKSQTTQNERYHKNIIKHFALCATQILTITQYNSVIRTQTVELTT